MSWLTTVVSQNDARLNRAGSVCPCMPGVLRTSSMQVKLVTHQPGQSLAPLIMGFGADFASSLDSHTGPGAALRCVALLFAPSAFANGPSLIDLHFQLKPWFIARGMALGEFFPGHDKASVHSDAMRPLDCPVHALVIRKVTPHDTAFVDADPRYSPAERETMKRHISGR